MKDSEEKVLEVKRLLNKRNLLEELKKGTQKPIKTVKRWRRRSKDEEDNEWVNII